MKELEEAINEFPVKELISFYNKQADDTIDYVERKRCLATVYWLTMFEKLPF